MSVEPFAPDETEQVEPIDALPQTEPSADHEPTDVPGDTPEGLGSERVAAPFTSETLPPAKGVAEALGNTGFDESEKADPV